MAIRVKLKPCFFDMPIGKEEFKVGDTGIEVSIDDVEDELLLEIYNICKFITGKKMRVFKMDKINKIIPLVSKWYEEV